MKVLVSAFACSPDAGSEPGAGWAWTCAAARNNEVWLLTRTKNRGPITAVLASMPDLRLHPVYLDLPESARRWKRGRRGTHPYYLIWQALAWRTARRLHRTVEFDVAHHLTFAVDWMPAGIAWLRDLPVIWGPVGGTTGVPWSLWRWLGWRGVIEEGLREVATRSARRCFGDATAHRAALVVGQNRDVVARFNFAREAVVEPNVALTLTPGTSLGVSDSSDTRRTAVFVGRLVPWKGLRLAIAALNAPGTADWFLEVYGEGREEPRCAALARRLGVERRVRFHGRRPRAEVLNALARADALVAPSMHEAAGWAVGEAVALGCPVICLDRGGPPVIAAAAPGSVVISADARAPARIAAALATCPEGSAPTDRWSADRLPGLLSDWYERVTRVARVDAEAVPVVPAVQSDSA